MTQTVMDFHSFISFEDVSDVPTGPHMHFLMYRQKCDAERNSRKTTVCNPGVSQIWEADSRSPCGIWNFVVQETFLGAEQHGHMNAVGYDLYCKMLSEAVKEAKGIHTMEDFETTIDLNMDAFIPDSYISNEYQKLDIYKRIAGIENSAGL